MSLAESEYRTQYKKTKCTASKTDPSLALFIGNTDGANANDDNGSEGRDRPPRRRRRQGHSRGGGRGGLSRKFYHNCVKFEHLIADYWSPVGGTCEGNGDDKDALGDEGGEFPGTDSRAILHLSQGSEPRSREL